MIELATDEIKTFPLDNHGLITAVCKDLRIAERIDAELVVHEKRTVSPGQAVLSLVVNGPGSVPLWMEPQNRNALGEQRLLVAEARSGNPW